MFPDQQETEVNSEGDARTRGSGETMIQAEGKKVLTGLCSAAPEVRRRKMAIKPDMSGPSPSSKSTKTHVFSVTINV